MLDNKKLKEIENRVKQHILDGLLKSKQRPENVEFFIENAKNSLESAKLLLDVSTSEELQEATGYLKFKGYLWAVNASYYSMFYTVRALLESSGVRLRSDLSVHTLTFDALVYYFYINGKLEKSLIEQFIQANEEAAEFLGKEEADKLVSDYLFEKNKRAKLTYETGEIALQNKAKTSVERAEKFNRALRKFIESKYI